MTRSSGIRTRWSALLVGSLLLLASSAAWAQSAPPDQPLPPAGEPVAAPPVPPPAPPLTFPSMGKNHEIMVAADTWFRIGLQAQVWADMISSSNAAHDSGFSANLFLRRARMVIAGQLVKNVSAYFQLDAPRIGQALGGSVATDGTTTATTKRFNAQDGGGEILQDAWAEVKLMGDALMLEGGLMIIPFSRNVLSGTTSYIGLEGGNTSGGLLPATSGTRDTGFQLKGYELDDQLEFRLGIFSGLRSAPTASNPNAHNLFRVTGFVQYNLFDTEKGYVFASTNLGKKKILGFSAGVDFQKADNVDAYLAFSGAVFGSWPLAGPNKAGGDEVAFVLQYANYNGGGATGVATDPGTFPIRGQNDVLAEVGYYNKDLSLSIFGKFEMQKFAEDADKAGNTQWFGGGVKYFVSEQNCNFTLAFNRIQFPDADSTKVKGQNQITLQLQVFYY